MDRTIRTQVSTSRSASKQFALIAMTQVFGLSVWFSAAAVTPGLVRDWGISVHQAAWLSMATQLGFAIGAIGVSLTGILDRFGPNKVLGFSALIVAALTGAFALSVTTLPIAIAIRFLTGIGLAGVYPPGLKLTATWSHENRSLRFGLLGGCLTIGSALPFLLNVFDALHWKTLVGATGISCAIAGVVSLIWIRTGPFAELSRKAVDAGYAWRMFKEAGPRSACLGYFGHMFELYAVWTWLPVFLMHSLNLNSITPSLAVEIFCCVGLGGFVGCVAGGWIAQRKGRRIVAIGALLISGLCCVISPLLFGSSITLLLPFAFIWGASVIADSGIFSAMLSSSANQQAVGTALSVQTAIGFLITLTTIQITPILAESYGWKNAFAYLAIGPALGILALIHSGSERSSAEF